MRNLILVLGLSLGLSSAVFAEVHEVQMRTSIERDGTLELMVFDPPLVTMKVGDTVRFVPTDAGHSVQSTFVPDGGPTWSSALDETVEIVLDTEGVYLYRCDPHRFVGMVGVLQVGEPLNLDRASEAAVELMTYTPMNQDRYQRYLSQIEPCHLSQDGWHFGCPA